jgi:DsbC/DsbD-like thiol-disulfide interchange protein
MVRAMLRPVLLPALTLAALLLSLLPARAVTQDDVLSARLLSGWAEPDGVRMAGLRLDLAPGWKTYWRAPGDAGIPPLFDWTGSRNVAAVHPHWPRPVVFDLNGMKTVGYHDGVVLPLEVVPVDPSAPVELRLQVELGVCKDICMPATLDLAGVLTGEGGSDQIRAALADQPVAGRRAGLAGVTCALEPIRDGLRVTARIDLPAQGGEETVVIESGQSGVWVSEAQVTREGRRLTAIADMVPPEGAPFALDRSGIVLTVIAGQNAVEIKGCPGE